MSDTMYADLTGQ